MTTPDKIARLPAPLRHRLNRCLQDGQPAAQLAGWLNAQPDAKTMLATEFAGDPITEADLNTWMAGDYLIWEMQQETLATVRQCGADVAELRQACPGSLADQLALCLTAQIAVAMRQFPSASHRHSSVGRVPPPGTPPETAVDSADSPTPLQHLHLMAMSLAALRQGDFAAHRRHRDREKLDAVKKLYRAEKAAFKKEVKVAKEGFKGVHISDEERERFHQELLRTF